jgi:hypothetical protein
VGDVGEGTVTLGVSELAVDQSGDAGSEVVHGVTSGLVPGSARRRVRAVLEGGAQLGPAAVDAAAHRAQLDAERRGDLLVREALDVAQDDGRPEVRGQGVEGLLDVAVE